MRTTILAALTVSLASVALAVPSAEARLLEPADRHVNKVRVTYLERDGIRLFVELNNGALYVLRPCKVEDSEHCYWDAQRRGNGYGRSFVRVAHRTLYVSLPPVLPVYAV